MSFVLGLDTTTAHCSVALLKEGRIIFSHQEFLPHAHSTELPLMVEMAFRESGTHPHDLTHVAVTKGPGSFTGVRIGFSFAEGLALAGDIPLLGAMTFYGMAPLEEESLYLIDTKCGDFYGAHLGKEKELIPHIYSIEDIEQTTFKTLFIESATSIKSAKNIIVSPPSAERLLLYIHAKGMEHFINPTPFYMRAPAIHGQSNLSI